MNQIDAIIAQVRVVLDELTELKKTMQPQPARLLFCSPVTGKIIGVRGNVYGGDWFDATGYAKAYNSSGVTAYHTGVDLNRPAYADSGAQVYAAADGRVVFDGDVPGWQGQVVVIEHCLEDSVIVWTRYAHILRNLTMVNGMVERGQSLGVIADYNRDGPRYDHLHFDVARIDLGAKPGDWPGNDKARVLRDYIDPAAWLFERAR